MPMSGTQTITVYLTSPAQHITQFDQSFIDLLVRFKIKTTGLKYTTVGGTTYSWPKAPDVLSSSMLSSHKEMYKHIYMFIGYKNAADAIGKYTIWHGNRTITNTLQNNASLESFLTNLYRSKAAKNGAKYVHSLYRNVQKMDTAVCGVYVPLYDLIEADGGVINIQFPICIPFNHILPFQAWDIFPNGVFDEIKMDIDLTPNSLVYCMVEPRYSLLHDFKTLNPVDKIVENAVDFDGTNGEAYDTENNGIFNDGQIPSDCFELMLRSSTEVPKTYVFDRNFTQIGLTARAINGLSIQYNQKAPTADTEGLTSIHILAKNDIYSWIRCTQEGMDVIRCDSYVSGFNMTPEALKEQKIKYTTEPYGFFAQKMLRTSFNSKPGESVININCNHALHKVTDLILLFPQFTEQITCFPNPHLQNIYLNVLNHNYPENGIDNTLSSSFYKMMINNSDLWYEEPSEEYLDSLTINHIDEAANPMARQILPTDTSSFAITLRTERPSAAGVIDDGLDSGGKNETITLTAAPMYTGRLNTYFYIYPTSASTELQSLRPVEPLLLLVNDMFFAFRRMPDGETRCIFTDGDVDDELERFMR
jgi:hypothetical protein